MSCVRLTRPDRAIISVLLTSVSWLHASLWRERGGGGQQTHKHNISVGYLAERVLPDVYKFTYYIRYACA